MVIVDTISIADRLQRAGMEEVIAKAVAKEVIVDRGNLATKEDLDILKVYIGHIEASLKSEMEQRFDGVAQCFDGVYRRFDGVAQCFDGVYRRFDGVDKRLDGVDKRFEQMDKRITATQWGIGIGFTVIATLILLVQFLG